MNPNDLPTATWHDNHAVLMPRDPDKDQKSRLGYFLDWLAWTRRPWYAPDLRAYRDYLLHERVKINPHTGNARPATLAPRSAGAHLATIRGRYEALLRDNDVRQWLYDLAPPDAAPADKKAFVDETLVRLQNAVHPSTAPIKTLTIQDEAASDHLRLKPHQVKTLLRTPGIGTLPGLRDTAMIAMLVCTGIREAEMVALTVDDLRQHLGDELALRVRGGKGYKQRLVPYGPLDWCLIYTDYWLSAAKITTGPVFRGFYKGYKTLRKYAISKRGVNKILNRYPIPIDGDLREIKPHDLRRTYARNAYERGMDMEQIRQNLGHVSVQTTQTYVGELDARQRQPPNMFTPPHRLSTLRQRWFFD